MQWKKGFTMVELLVVLIILAILVAVAAPMYFANVRRARASEAIAITGQVRQAQRDYFVSHNIYFDIAAGNIDSPLPTSVVVATGVPTPATAGVNVDPGVVQYFDDDSIVVTAIDHDSDGASNLFLTPSAQDFLVTATGTHSIACAGGGSTDCATKAAEVAGYIVEMDNSGRAFVSYNAGTNWEAY